MECTIDLSIDNLLRAIVLS